MAMELKDLETAITDAVTPVMTAFEEFKATNEERIKEQVKHGVADVLTEEKLTRINTTLDAFEGINQKMVLLEKSKDNVAELQKSFDALETAFKRLPSTGDPLEKKDRTQLWCKAVVGAGTIGIPNLSEEERKLLSDVNGEYKALSVIPDASGGYLAPPEYVQEIIKAETLMSPVRSLARVRTTTAKSVQIPKRTAQFAAQWVAEQGTRSETTGLAYGLWEIPNSELYALVDISNQMLEDSAFNMSAEVSSESAEQFAVAEGTAFVSGNGVGRPLGFMVDTNVGTTNSGAATTVTADGLLSLKHAIKTAYARAATWVMNRTTIGSVRKLKDGNGNYLWIPGIGQGAPNTIDGDPYVEVPDMPSEGAGLKPVAYGDFRRAYTWVDRLAMEMLRDPYTQATSGNVRFIMRKRVGGQVTLAEAIRTLTCST